MKYIDFTEHILLSMFNIILINLTTQNEFQIHFRLGYLSV